MADLKWTHVLRADQRSNPVVFARIVTMPASLFVPSEHDLLRVFVGATYQLQTWGRSKDPRTGKTILRDDPHWIAVRGQTPLHWDPAYPRYSHHLKLRVDAGYWIRGLDRNATVLTRGLYYVLDTHSPHQVVCTTKPPGWNVAVSLDADQVREERATVQRLLGYAMNAPFVT